MKISPINSVQHVKMTVILNQAVHMKNGEKTEKKRVGGLNLNNLEKLKELVPEFGESKNLSDERYKRGKYEDDYRSVAVERSLRIKKYRTRRKQR